MGSRTMCCVADLITVSHTWGKSTIVRTRKLVYDTPNVEGGRYHIEEGGSMSTSTLRATRSSVYLC